MRALFLLIFLVVSLVADCDISSVVSLERDGISLGDKSIVNQNIQEHYKIKTSKIKSNKQVAISITAQFDTLVSVSFTSATMAKFDYKISNSIQNSHLICNNTYQNNGYKSQDIILKSGENLLITFGVADMGLSDYDFESEIVLNMLSPSQNSKSYESFGEIYTQIIGREFEVEFQTTSVISDFEIWLNNRYKIYQSSTFSGGKIPLMIPNLPTIDYKNLYLIAKFKDQKANSKQIQSSKFNARVAKFKLENIPQNPKGGVKYRDFKLIALDYNGNVVTGYNGHFSGDFIGHTLENCVANLSSETIEFKDGVGVISTDKDGFVYPDIGVARIEFIDRQNSDKIHQGCLINSFTNDPNELGLIGCDAGISKDIAYFDYDKIVHTNTIFGSKFGLFGVMDENLSLSQYGDFMGVSANLEFQVRLSDNSVAKLFSAGCYGDDVSFGNSSRLSLHALSEPNDDHIYKSSENSYTVSKNSFKNGIAKAWLKVSLPREKPQNPYKILSSDIDLNLTQKPNLSQDYSYLYYAKAYGDKLSQAVNYPYIAKIYFAIFCDNECQNIAKNSSEYSPVLDENMSGVSELRDYFVFKNFNASKDIVKFNSTLNSSDVIDGVMEIEINSEQKSEFEINNTHFYGGDFVWVRLFKDSSWVGVGDFGEVMGIQNGQNIRYNHTIEW
ncbi:hypothetical protein [Campylobacter devanensis]|uniref:hypothetical protein n=1 Tax=Campylobacter devanensis TaxID=3161138 RepID=UPI000A330798|nr:hypothetical protein [Campylobacter sp. P0187]